MSKSIDTIRAEYERAEQKLQKLGGEYDDAKAKLKERYADRLAAASEEAAAAQKAYCDAEAAAELQRRIDEFDPGDLPDADRARAVENNRAAVRNDADRLGLTLPE